MVASPIENSAKSEHKCPSTESTLVIISVTQEDLAVPEPRKWPSVVPSAGCNPTYQQSEFTHCSRPTRLHNGVLNGSGGRAVQEPLQQPRENFWNLAPSSDFNEWHVWVSFRGGTLKCAYSLFACWGYTMLYRHVLFWNITGSIELVSFLLDELVQLLQVLP